MSYPTHIRKGHDGWRAESEAELGETPEGTRMLELTTYKVRGGLAASANVFIKKDSGNGYFTKSTMIFQDFNKQGIAATPCKRVTEKAIHEVHSRALLEMDSLVDEAKAFYQIEAPTPN